MRQERLSACMCFGSSRELSLIHIFGGHLMATIICPRFRPCMATVRPGVMKKNPFDQAKADACEIVKPAFELSESDLHLSLIHI